MSLNPDRASAPLLPRLPRSLHMSGRLPSTVQAYENEAESQWGMGRGAELLLLLVVEEEEERHG